MVLDSGPECFHLMDNLLPSSSDTLVDDLTSTVSSSKYEVIFPYSYSKSSTSCPERSCRAVTDDFYLMEQHYATCHHHHCSLCGVSFMSSRLLSVHEQIVHPGPFRLKLDCFLSRCPQKFSDPTELFKHAHDSHGLSPDSPILTGALLSVEDHYSVKIMPEFRVHHWNEPVDGQLTLENMLKKLKSEDCSCVTYRFKPGTDFPVHTHDEDKMDCIVSGQLSFTMYGKEITLGPGDRLEVPRNEPHSARVIGQSPLLFVDATRRSSNFSDH